MKAAIIIALSLGCAPLHATVISYTDETLFLAAAGATTLESFEDEVVANGTPSVATTYFTATASALGTTVASVSVGNPLGWASDGTHVLGISQTTRMDATLGSPIYALGFDVISASESTTQSGGQSFVRLELPGGQQFVMSSCPPCLQSPGYPGHADYFFGVVSDQPFNTFAIVNTAFADAVAIDRVQLTAVPLPGAGWLLLPIFSVLGFTRRRI